MNEQMNPQLNPHGRFKGPNCFNMLWLEVFGMRSDCRGACRLTILKVCKGLLLVMLQVWNLEWSFIVSAMLELWHLACFSPPSIYDICVAVVELCSERNTMKIKLLSFLSVVF